ncbi:hypothetical protein [Streptomyces tritici]|uniref:hypothetical protein n=1 Tax=Streptomyces tritici TaxID=2054410 RepID=UPI003AF12E39
MTKTPWWPLAPSGVVPLRRSVWTCPVPAVARTVRIRPSAPVAAAATAVAGGDALSVPGAPS